MTTATKKRAGIAEADASAPFDVERVRSDFPILYREIYGKPLVYLDNGASAQKPQVVIDAITNAYAMEYANVHRGLHYLSNLASFQTRHGPAIGDHVDAFGCTRVQNDLIFAGGIQEPGDDAPHGLVLIRCQI